MSYQELGVERSGLFLLVAAITLCGCNLVGGGGSSGDLGVLDPGPGTGLPLKADTVTPLPALSVDPPTPVGGTMTRVVVDGTGATSVTLTGTGDGCGNFLGTTTAGPGVLRLTDTTGTFGECVLTADIARAGTAATADVVTRLQTSFMVEPSDLQLPAITVQGGLFVPGDLPVPDMGVVSATQVGSLSVPGTIINGGTVELRITLADVTQLPLLRNVLVQIRGVGGARGFFRSPVRLDGDVVVVRLRLARDFIGPAPLDGGPAIAAAAAATIEVALIDAFGDPSTTSMTMTTTQDVGTGDVQVSVSWDSPTDVDLHVVEPSGEEIYFGNTSSATGGMLDLDSNPACSIDGINNENIVWAAGTAPTGEYIVRVDYWEDCGGNSANFLVTTTVCNESTMFSGFFAPGTDDQGSAGSGREITRFDNLSCQSRVRGTAMYEDLAQTSTGLAAMPTLLPIRFAVIEVQRVSDEVVLETSETKQDGTFDISFRNDGDPGYKVIVFTQQENATLGNQSVRNFTGGLYAVESAEIDESVEPDKEGVELVASTAVTGPAFNILDTGVTGAMLIRSRHGTAPPDLNWLWTKGEQGSCGSDVSCYFDSTTLISVLSIPADPDEYDDLVLLHEYGHFWQNRFSDEDSPGGNHTFTSRSDPQLAWGEGSATFFGNYAKRTSLYIDTNAGGVGVRSDIESLDASIPLGTSDMTQSGNHSELLVAAMLWDLSDSTNETNDTLANPTATFDALGQLKVATTDRGTTGAEVVDFLDAWFCRGHANRGNATSGVQGNVVGIHQFNYDFAAQASCR